MLNNQEKIVELIIFGFLTIVFALSLNFAYTEIGGQWLTFGALGVLVLVVGNWAVMAFIVNRGKSNEFNEQVNLVAKLVEPRQYSWLLPEEELSQIELSTLGAL